MRDERSLRRDDFEWGVPVRLADRQYWNLPTPESLASRALDAEETARYRALARSIVESESRAEVLQAELALAIFLLGRNYHLSPSLCFQALRFEPGDPALSEAQEAIHSLAMDHVRARRAQAEPRPVATVARTRRMSFLGRVRASLTA